MASNSGNGGAIRGARKEMRPILRELSRQGWDLSVTGSNHIRAISPDGDSVYLPLTPDSGRVTRHILPRLRKAGFEWPRKGRR